MCLNTFALHTNFIVIVIISLLPLIESQDEIYRVLNGMKNSMCGKKMEEVEAEEPLKSIRKQTMDEDEGSADTPDEAEVEPIEGEVPPAEEAA